MNKNLVILIGRVGKEPEMRYTPSGKAVTTFSLATSYKRSEGEEKTEWHNIQTWGKLAENIGQYVVKGQELEVEGRIEYQTWDKLEGGKGYKTVIVANEVQFGQKPNGAAASAGQNSQFEETPVEEEPPF